MLELLIVRSLPLQYLRVFPVKKNSTNCLSHYVLVSLLYHMSDSHDGVRG